VPAGIVDETGAAYAADAGLRHQKILKKVVKFVAATD
jgi:hypothetical protein